MGDPIHQFQISNLFTMGQMGPWSIAFTNSALFMVLAVGVVIVFLLGSTRQRSMVPGRLQSLAEISYEFVATTVRNSAGNEGMKFFPFVFSLFMFILAANLLGLLPYGFTITSHIIITVAMALMVFITVLVYGF